MTRTTIDQPDVEFEQDGDLGTGVLHIPTQEELEAEAKKVEAIKQKIMKMMARGKAGSGATDEERETAMALATDFAVRNGLNLYELEKEMNRDVRFVLKKLDLLGHANWRLQLADALCRALIIRFVIHREYQSSKANARSGKSWRVPRADYISCVGMPSDIEVLEYLFVFITRELEKLADAAYKREKVRCLEALEMPTSGKAFRDDFYRGAIATIAAKVKILFAMERDEETEDEHEHTMALVPLKEADATSARDKFFPKLGKARDYYGKALPEFKHDPARERKARAARRSAYDLGREAGHDVALRKGINGNETLGLPSGK